MTESNPDGPLVVPDRMNATQKMAWVRRHSVWNHLAAPFWLRVPERHRMRFVQWLDHSQRRCWSDLVTVALTYRDGDDLCDTPVPSLRPSGAERCRTLCEWHHDHGSQQCGCYCGKFQFVTAPTTDGAAAKAAS